MTILERSLISKGLAVKGLVDGLISPPPQRWVYNFDGIDDYGVLDTRAINVDGDIDIEFYLMSGFVTGRTLVAQNVNSTSSLREFQLTVDLSSFGLVVGGAFVNIPLTPSEGYYKISLNGSNLVTYKNGIQLDIRTFNRGAAREPTAKTLFGCRGNGVGSFVGFYSGRAYNLKINGVLWEMRNNGSAIQPSTPAGNNMTLVNSNPDRWSKIPA